MCVNEICDVGKYCKQGVCSYADCDARGKYNPAQFNQVACAYGEHTWANINIVDEFVQISANVIMMGQKNIVYNACVAVICDENQYCIDGICSDVGLCDSFSSHNPYGRILAMVTYMYYGNTA